MMTIQTLLLLVFLPCSSCFLGLRMVGQLDLEHLRPIISRSLIFSFFFFLQFFYCYLFSLEKNKGSTCTAMFFSKPCHSQGYGIRSNLLKTTSKVHWIPCFVSTLCMSPSLGHFLPFSFLFLKEKTQLLCLLYGATPQPASHLASVTYEYQLQQKNKSALLCLLINYLFRSISLTCIYDSLHRLSYEVS